jgi:hypothetical protein
MTRKAIFDQAQFKARGSVPSLSVSIGLTLYDMSVAEQTIEQRTGAVKRVSTITLDPESANGQYALPADLNAIDGLWFAPPNAPNPYFYRVPLWEPDYWREQVTALQSNSIVPIPHPLPPVTTPWQNTSMAAMIEFGVLNVTPFSGITGVLTLRYKPYLTPYSPESPLWAAYAGDPEPAMMTNGLDDESLGAATNGIVLWCAAQMLRASPGGVALHRREILDMEAEFERSIWAVARNTIGPINSTPQKLAPVGGRF